MIEDGLFGLFVVRVAHAFDEPLRSGSLRIVAYEYDERAFGNAFVEFAGPRVKLMVVLERGQVYATADAMRQNRWVPLEYFAQAAGLWSSGSGMLASIEAVAAFVSKHLGHLEDSLAPGNRQRTLLLLDERLSRAPREPDQDPR